MPEVPGSILGGDVHFSIFFLVEKIFDDKMAPTVCKIEICSSECPHYDSPI